jgi:hypothetical protein
VLQEILSRLGIHIENRADSQKSVRQSHLAALFETEAGNMAVARRRATAIDNRQGGNDIRLTPPDHLA